MTPETAEPLGNFMGLFIVIAGVALLLLLANMGIVTFHDRRDARKQSDRIRPRTGPDT